MTSLLAPVYTPLVSRAVARYRRMVAIEDMPAEDVYWAVWREPGANECNRTRHTSMADAKEFNRVNGNYDAWVEVEMASDLF